jgi:polysaccharide export outer membrane protein
MPGCARQAQYVEQVSPPANIPAARMYASSPASAQQAYEQPPRSPDLKPAADNRGLFTSGQLAMASATPPAQQMNVPRSAPAPQNYRQPPSIRPDDQLAADNNRGLLTSNWNSPSSEAAPAPPRPSAAASVYASSPAPSRQMQQAYDQTGSVPAPAQQQPDDNRGFFSSRAASPAPQRTVPAASLYASSAASAQQAYEQPPPPQQDAQPGSRGLFTSRFDAAYVTPPARKPGGTGGPYVAANSYASAAVPPAGDPVYTLDAGDKLRVVVFGQDGISNSYIVDASGKVNLPLIGAVTARGLTNQQLSEAIAARLKQGFIREPHVTVEVETYRPFFILGEVTTPGQYPYVANMTAQTAVAIAGGFAPRAAKKTVELTRKGSGQHLEVPLEYPVRPGDTIVVKERWF